MRKPSTRSFDREAIASASVGRIHSPLPIASPATSSGAAPELSFLSRGSDASKQLGEIAAAQCLLSSDCGAISL